ncbi:transcriptional regulator, XRE family [Methylobacterium sp. 4-46]|uniref:cupin domain-containing protein n=1 Tax=unclassified Methylobacterium TaxID=2615210 RepID=UPI000165C600|nr:MULTISPECIES: cupin domain-containing protein [Methylobacterium]ACA17967.1 transcriptional regulator, XRE family [Methylobacterium sp. 4-46]WFT77269.1 cupin domain-containing protein [Methylobacterium nodulans]
MKQAGTGRGNGQAAPRAGERAADLAMGRRLRALRQARGLSLKAIAARTGLSIGFLSQVERGLSSPSLRVLTQLADLLEVGLASLFGAAPGPAEPIVTRPHERAELTLWRSGIAKQLLTRPGADGHLSLFLMRLAPGASTGDEALTHGGEEAGLVLEGRLALWVEDAALSLAAGDSFRFASRRPHRYGNPSETDEAVVLWVNAVPPGA